jgi:hypothetical protein
LNQSRLFSVWWPGFRVSRFYDDFHPGADGVTVAGRAAEFDGDEAVPGRVVVGLVQHQAQTRAGAILQPYVEVTVMVPVHRSQRAGVIGEIEAGGG